MGPNYKLSRCSVVFLEVVVLFSSGIQVVCLELLSIPIPLYRNSVSPLFAYLVQDVSIRVHAVVSSIRPLTSSRGAHDTQRRQSFDCINNIQFAEARRWVVSISLNSKQSSFYRTCYVAMLICLQHERMASTWRTDANGYGYEKTHLFHSFFPP